MVVPVEGVDQEVGEVLKTHPPVASSNFGAVLPRMGFRAGRAGAGVGHGLWFFVCRVVRGTISGCGTTRPLRP